jgi:hypothetical protein
MIMEEIKIAEELWLIIAEGMMSEAEFTGAVDVPEAKQAKVNRMMNEILELIR